MGEVIPLESRRRTGDVPSGHRPGRPLRATRFPGSGHRDDDGPVRASPRGPSTEAEPLWREVVGRRLRDLRHARGDRLADTAERAGMSPQYLSEVERGRKDPSSEMLAAVAGALGVPVREVLRLTHADLARGGAQGPVMLAA